MVAHDRNTVLEVGGERFTGQAVRDQNVMAALSVANIVKSSFGPVGLDKMLVDDIGDVTISNDGATILRLLEVEHPAAKILVELAQQQDTEVGDGTTSVVLLAAELLRRANDLVRKHIHPTTIISGYRLASKEACRFIQEQMSHRVDQLGRNCLLNAARTSMSSKIIASESDLFAQLAVDAMLAVRTVEGAVSPSATAMSQTSLSAAQQQQALTQQSAVHHTQHQQAAQQRLPSSLPGAADAKYPVKAVHILKAHGKSARESVLVNGCALNCTVASQAMRKRIVGAKIACLDVNLQRVKLPLGVQVVIEDPEKLEDIRQREIDITKERVAKVLATGANVVLTTKGIDDMCLKLFVEANAMAVRRCKLEDLKRISKATGATLVTTLANLEGEESFDPSFLGYAEEVVQERISDDECILIRGTKAHSSASIILRGPNDYMLDEMERSLHDALCVVKRTLESNVVVAGGGAVEAALSIFLENFATTLASREQLAIAEFASALLVIPKTLAVNAAKDSVDLVAKLRACHHAAQTNSSMAHMSTMGLDLVKGEVRDNLKTGVLEPAMIKIKSIKSATEAAIAILRIDDLIKMEPEKKEGGYDPHGH